MIRKAGRKEEKRERNKGKEERQGKKLGTKFTLGRNKCGSDLMRKMHLLR